jgi:predicted transcriptional regulator
MSQIVTLPDDVVIEKGDNDLFRVTAWGSVEVYDKEEQMIPMDQLLKDAPMMMAHSPKVHLGHTDTEVGTLHDIKFMKKGDVPAARISYDLYGERRFHKATRKKVESGELGSVSVKGFAYQKDYVQADGKMKEVLKDIETVTFALCKNGMNPEATVIDINGKSFNKSDDLNLMRDPVFLQHIQTYMKDGLSYKQSLDAAKSLYSNELHKAMLNDLEPLVISKEGCGEGEAGSDDEKKEKKEHKEKTKEVDKMSDELKKQVEDLTKALKDATEKIDSLSKENVTLKETKVQKAEPDIKAEVMKVLTENFDSILEAKGFQKATAPVVNQVTQNDLLATLQKADKKDQIAFYEALMKAKETHTNSNMGDIPSREEMEKSLNKVGVN